MNDNRWDKAYKSQLRDMHARSYARRKMQGVADRTGRRTLQVVIMVEKGDAARQHKHAGEKPGGDSSARQMPQAIARRDISEPGPKRNPAGYGLPWLCTYEGAYMIHGSSQPADIKGL